MKEKYEYLPDRGLICAGAIVRNPSQEGLPVDGIFINPIGNRQILFAIVDNDEPIGEEVQAREVLQHDELLSLISQIEPIPSMEIAMDIMSRFLTDRQSTMRVGFLAKDERDNEVLLTGAVGSDIPTLKVLDAVSHKVIPVKDDEQIVYKEVTLRKHTLHPDRIYMLLGSGIYENLGEDEVQNVINQSAPTNDLFGTQQELESLAQKIAIEARNRIEKGLQRRGRRNVKVVPNDCTVVLFQTPPETEHKQTISQNPSTLLLRIFYEISRLKSQTQSFPIMTSLSLILSKRLPERERDEMLRRLKNDLEKGKSTDGIEILSRLLSHTDSSDIERDLKFHGFTSNDLQTFIHSSAMWDMISVMIDYGKDFHAALSIILAEIPLTAIPDRVREKLGNIPQRSELEVFPWFENWYICDIFAARMKRALKVGGIIFVNDIPFKLNGKFSGITLETFSDGSQEETLLEGTIVSLVDKTQREFIRQSFDRGISRITFPDLQLAIMRPWNPHEADRSWKTMIERLRKYRESVPDHLPAYIGKLTRKKWRERNREDN